MAAGGRVYEQVEFTSEGATLRGRLYRPPGVKQPPLVVMAHGFSATIVMTADRYAEAFHTGGFAVLLYDHRNFGASDGDPRYQIDAAQQVLGYLDAIEFATKLPDVDADRIAIWGDSLSGAEVIVAAAIDPRVKAVVAQVPACSAEPAPADPDGELFRAMRDRIVQGGFDPSAEAVRGPLPVVSFDQMGTPSLLTPLTAYRWFIEYGGRHNTGWVNRATRVDPTAYGPYHAGLAAPHLNAALLVLLSPDDEMPGAAPSVTRAAFDAVPGAKKLVEIDGGHFGLVYVPSDEFSHASSAQVAFLREHLQP
jgi:pimeloyl-ACP methyl ester carboxylesterase